MEGGRGGRDRGREGREGGREGEGRSILHFMQFPKEGKW